ncbi:hypothetical protein ID1079_13460 [Helicobacter pylori]
MNATNLLQYPIHLSSVGSVRSYAFIDRCVRPVGNALEIKLCKIH